MIMYLYRLIYFEIFIYIFEITSARFICEIRMIWFKNSQSKTANNEYCDSRSHCDTQFTLKIKIGDSLVRHLKSNIYYNKDNFEVEELKRMTAYFRMESKNYIFFNLNVYDDDYFYYERIGTYDLKIYAKRMNMFRVLGGRVKINVIIKCDNLLCGDYCDYKKSRYCNSDNKMICHDGYVMNATTCNQCNCQHNVKCLRIYSRSGIKCTCVVNWENENNECIEENQCYSNPCKNDGLCDFSSKYLHCKCQKGTVGRLCEINIDDCKDKNCNHGRCYDGINTFTCKCHLGYDGKYCNDVLKRCKSSVCENGGICYKENLLFKCNCTNKFAGDICEHLIGICKNNSKCIGKYSSCYRIDNRDICKCESGLIGQNCQRDKDECKSNPCMHSGTCHNFHNWFKCECKQQYQGTTCQVFTDNCNQEFCNNNGKCVTHQGVFKCKCFGGFIGKHCYENVNECVNITCYNKGYCEDLANSFRCKCVEEYMGMFCELRIPYCQIHKPCLNNAMCLQPKNNKSKYSCTCAKDYYGNNCQYTHTCKRNKNICNNGTCHKTIRNEYICSCEIGVTNGEKCEKKSKCSLKCKNNGRCVIYRKKAQCLCSNRFYGPNCIKKRKFRGLFTYIVDTKLMTAERRKLFMLYLNAIINNSLKKIEITNSSCYTDDGIKTMLIFDIMKNNSLSNCVFLKKKYRDYELCQELRDALTLVREYDDFKELTDSLPCNDSAYTFINGFISTILIICFTISTIVLAVIIFKTIRRSKKLSDEPSKSMKVVSSDSMNTKW